MTILSGKGKGGVETPGWCIHPAHIFDLNITVLQDTAPHREAWLNQGSPGKGKGEGRGPRRSWQPTEERLRAL